MKPTVLVLGSGPIRIGQGIEFDYSCVHCVWALRKAGYRAVIVNNNPETVSTDFDTGDGLYFEPVTLEDVLRIVAHEKADGVVVQFGGQTAINLAAGIEAAGVKVFGTQPAAIAAAEDRDQFERLLTKLGVPKPAGRAVRSLDEARLVAAEVGYPVLVRPSFVLGGRAMDIVFDEGQLSGFYQEAEDANPGQPVLVDKYVLGKEAEVDVISDGEDTLVPGIMEHVERAGVHSGDSMAVFPPVSLSLDVQWRMVEIACLTARELGVKGVMNIQFVVENDEVSVIEVNPRASRTVPYLSKVTGVPMVALATRTMMGGTLKDLGYGSGLWCRGPADGGGPRAVGKDEFLAGRCRQSNLFAVKAPVFSFQKLAKVEPSLGPEMKSTGEVLGIDTSYESALYKALVSSGVTFKRKGQVIVTVADADKAAIVPIAADLAARGYSLAATGGTHDALTAGGVKAERLNKIQQGSPNILERLFHGEVSLMINTPGPANLATADAARIRRACIETGVACVTSIDTAAALAKALAVFEDPSLSECRTVTEYLAL
ncbi:MAG: carbamoyl-phosphate synthase large subunit [Armatimonadetes bacterium]|nr:carbamoyl-phosphate synthase large subunit [Armatimonadota bacterium]